VAINAITADVGVVVVCRQPRDRRVTVVAVIATGYVRGMLAGRSDAVMTRAAAAENLCMVDGDGWYPGGRAVTVFAHVRCKNVRRILARRSHAVVTVVAATRNAGVIEVGGQPACRRVAVFADVAATDVRRCFASSSNAIVAATTVADDTEVIKIRRNPCRRGVTVVAVVGAGHMCRMFSGSHNAIVTGATGADHARMINSGWRYPGDNTMTILANIGRLNMRRVLAGRIGTVVTIRAIAGDVDVVEVRRHPRNGHVAIIAGVATGDMCGRLAGCDIAIVTGFAGTNYLGVIDDYRRRPNVHAMTIFTNRGCLNMCDVLASRIGTVMAVHTIAGDGRMVKIGWRPANGRVAVVAVIATGEVRRMFASRCDPIVTGAAAAQHLRVIDSVRR